MGEALARRKAGCGHVAGGTFDYAYPMAVLTRDGKVYLIFTSHERTVLNHSVLDEDSSEAKCPRGGIFLQLKLYQT